MMISPESPIKIPKRKVKRKPTKMKGLFFTDKYLSSLKDNNPQNNKKKIPIMKPQVKKNRRLKTQRTKIRIGIMNLLIKREGL